MPVPGDSSDRIAQRQQATRISLNAKESAIKIKGLIRQGWEEVAREYAKDRIGIFERSAIRLLELLSPLSNCDLIDIGWRTVQLERDFNIRCGFSNLDDRPPTFFLEERLPLHQLSFDIQPEDLDKALTRPD
jgi:hypothetical protein